MAHETLLTVTGNLTADPELRSTRNGGTVVNFTIASTERSYNSQSQSWEDSNTIFMRCTAWDGQNAKLASNVASTLKKGSHVIAQGILRARSWQTEQGENRTTLELTVNSIGVDLNQKPLAQTPTTQYADSSYATPPTVTGSDPWDANGGDDIAF